MRGLAAEIAFDRRRCHELEPVPVALTVTNRWPWPVWGLLVERGFLETGDDGEPAAAVALARVAGWSRSRFEFAFAPPRRGLYPRETPMLATGFPFGLWLSQRPIAVERTLIAWPRRIDLRSLPLLTGDRMASVGGFVDRPGHDGEILAARHYQQGDSLRRIHWAHTARRDTLIVCQRQTASRRSIVVALDGGAFGDEARRQREIVDWSLRVVASLCGEFHGHACELSCELNGERYPVAPTATALHRLFDRLAGFEQPTPNGGSGEGTPAYPPGELVVLVTTASRWQRSAELPRHCRSSSVRIIVLDFESAEGCAEEGAARHADASAACWAERRSRPWMRLKLSDDLARQLQYQWEKQCHEDWCVT
jgi:hypothetical protein